MAKFDKAWLLTQSWEGKWSPKAEAGSADEENVYGAFWGTNYGLTGKYMKEFAGYAATQRVAFTKMNATECGEIWKKTRWKWLQGDKINSQEIANILFDWFVMRNQRAIYGLCKALDPSVAADNWAKTLYVKKYMNKLEGGKPASPTDGFYGLSDFAIQQINASNEAALHAKIKELRNSISKTNTNSIKNRYASFDVTGSNDKNIYCSRNGCNDGRGGVSGTNDVLFETYFIYGTDTPTQSENNFFRQIRQAGNEAWDLYGQSNLSNAIYLTTVNKFAATYNKKVPAASVVVFYRNNGNEQFKAAYLKGIGNVAAWKRTFLDIFQKVIVESKEKDGSDKDGTGTGQDGNGTGNGGNGNGNGTRPCTPLDTLLAKIGLGDFRKYIFGGGAVLLGVNAVSSNSQAGKYVSGGGALALAYLALTEPVRCGDESDKKKV